MSRKRKNEDPLEVSSPKRPRLTVDSQLPEAERSPENCTNIACLPDEVMLKIFSHLSHRELYFSVGEVCHKWKELISTPTLWREIDVGENVSTETLTNWIRCAKLLKSFKMRDRYDADVIIKELSENCKHLKSVKFQNCHGSLENSKIDSTHLYKLIKRCRKLDDFDFSCSRFSSKKFFQLIPRYRISGRFKKRFRLGTARQMRDALVALWNSETDHLRFLKSQPESLNLGDSIRVFVQSQNSKAKLYVVQGYLNLLMNLIEIEEEGREDTGERRN